MKEQLYDEKKKSWITIDTSGSALSRFFTQIEVQIDGRFLGMVGRDEEKSFEIKPGNHQVCVSARMQTGNESAGSGGVYASSNTMTFSIGEEETENGM